jgi:hypothetical protein
MADGNKGIVSSIAVHLGIVAVLVGVSWYASHSSGQAVDPVDPLMVDLNGTPGRRPGELGKATGVAQGDPSGSKTGIAIIKIKKLDLEQIKADARREADEAALASNPSGKSSSKTSKSNSSSSKTSLSEFNNSRGSKSNGSGKVASIGGVTVKTGRNYGKGENGGEGGSASEQQIYAGEVKARLQSAWTSLIATEPSITAGSCGVIVKIDAAGNASFGGWINKPKDASLVEIVKRACSQIGNCGAPPGRRAFTIEFPNVGVTE